MTREIKFRAWDTYYNTWAHFTMSHFVEGECLDIMQRCKNWGEWTGLKDKNGVEIYEGDILTVTHDHDYRATIKFGWSVDGFYGWHWDSQVVGKKSVSSRNAIADVDDVSGRYEVIGNIYENPELLTPSNQQVGKQEEV